MRHTDIHVYMNYCIHELSMKCNLYRSYYMVMCLCRYMLWICLLLTIIIRLTQYDPHTDRVSFPAFYYPFTLLWYVGCFCMVFLCVRVILNFNLMLVNKLLYIIYMHVSSYYAFIHVISVYTHPSSIICRFIARVLVLFVIILYRR